MLLSVRRQVLIVRQYNNIAIDSKLNGFFLPDTQPLQQRFYNGRIVYQYKSVRVGLTTLRKQPACYLPITVEELILPF
jgi:hypothetical protein